jgi:LemA protein
MKKFGCLIAVAVVVLILGMSLVGVYNGLVKSQQAVDAQWGNVQNAYQRRADLIPNLVASVKGSAAFEQTTLTQVTEARSRVGAVAPQATADILNDPQKFAKFQAAQDGLGTENRINVERRSFNESAQEYNTRIKTFPAALFAAMMGFQPKAYFQTTSPGAENAPKVDFGTGTTPPSAAPAPGH